MYYRLLTTSSCLHHTHASILRTCLASTVKQLCGSDTLMMCRGGNIYERRREDGPLWKLTDVMPASVVDATAQKSFLLLYLFIWLMIFQLSISYSRFEFLYCDWHA